MKNINFKKSIEHSKIVWEEPDMFFRHFSLVFIITTTCFIICLLFNDNYNQNRSFNIISKNIQFAALLTASSLFAGFTLFSSITKTQRLIPIKSIVSFEQIRETLKEKLETCGWRIERSNGEYMIATKGGKWFVGTQATILFHKNVIYLNIQNQEGARGYFPFSFGRNKGLLNELIRALPASA
jgi:hypothetical protein